MKPIRYAVNAAPNSVSTLPLSASSIFGAVAIVNTANPRTYDDCIKSAEKILLGDISVLVGLKKCIDPANFILQI